MTLALTLVFLAGNAFFVAAQFALITTRRDQIEPLAAAGRRGARAALGQIRTLPHMLAGTQLGIALCSLGLGAVAEPAFAHLLSDGFDAVSVPDAVLHPAAFVLALALISFSHMVLGEMVPKNISLADPLRASLWLGGPMGVWVRVTRPVLVVINGLANGVLRLVGIRPQSEHAGSFTPEEFGHMFADSVTEGLLDEDDRERLNRALTLDRLRADSVLLPLAELQTVPSDVTGAELERLVATTGYSRYPIRDGDRLTGYVHAKDLLELDPDAWDQPIPARMVRVMPTVDADVSLSDALMAMQHSGSHIARVADGERTLGIIALEDVLTQLVGEHPA
jgi:CBS domain containing-hemolysin-like protein